MTTTQTVSLVLLSLAMTGCAAQKPAARRPTYPWTESVVLAGTTPTNLMTTGVRPERVTVRSTYLPGGTRYENGRDYVVDVDAGTIARTATSRIPDFATNVLYG